MANKDTMEIRFCPCHVAEIVLQYLDVRLLDVFVHNQLYHHDAVFRCWDDDDNDKAFQNDTRELEQHIDMVNTLHPMATLLAPKACIISIVVPSIILRDQISSYVDVSVNIWRRI
ncbi:hypothetical protein O0I10_008448 [Lichtheimia ornata]|uniref:Uncharacterized protein n=1 Tax=Lichtheimia ornata TaxID=688661 RepID=A0AAD7UZC4_9FUNG|nr:uncharacterized protein O0I10_008448 [Lichtheimia ornata]KAJ8655784.1 hypothetical protein O0I10_008448 [Lichtheimia ornata]